MIEHIKTFEEVERVSVVVCNKCGKRIVPEDYIEWQEAFIYQFLTGYGSVFGDSADLSVELCQHCMKELLGPYIRQKDVILREGLLRGRFTVRQPHTAELENMALSFASAATGSQIQSTAPVSGAIPHSGNAPEPRGWRA